MTISKDTLWHKKKQKEIIDKYPKVINIQGQFTPSFFIIILLSIFQWYSAYIVENYNFSILSIFILSFINANTLYHSFGSFIHENSHFLVLGSKLKPLVSFVLELGLSSFGEHVKYEYTHIRKHHTSLNVKGVDSECTNDGHMSTLTNITNNIYVNRLLYLIDLLPFGSILSQEYMKSKVKNKYKVELNKNDLFYINIYRVSSFLIFSYLLFCGYYKMFLFKIWTLSIYQGKFSIFRRGQSISEHYVEKYNNDVPTQSTYGFIENLIGFNTGYHDEHHTFPLVSWYYLPRLKKIAPEYFKNENKFSYLKLWYRWFKSDFKKTYYRDCDTNN
jgi:sphingolipid delta-4 desaturase